ncbi:MAG: SGNH/GDSL hydrolase family protein [Akkermansiaceae bacterium]|nr:SGNH/GDSL hydrolase family protein [Akkermansiaceae bacterium]
MKSIRTLFRISALSLVVACAATLHAEPAPLKLKDNDLWVMVGDSITAQRQHSNYIEMYYRTRHPELKLHFRNSGIGGNRTQHVLDRFDYDVAAWKPTIVSVELGMNDVGGEFAKTLPAYVNGMKKIIAKIREIPATPILISSSPVDDGSKMNDWRGDRCKTIHPFTEALQKLAAEEDVLFVDQYHPLIDVWGDNRRKGAELAAKNPQPEPTPAPSPDGKPAKPKLPPSLIPLGGDPVHPGPVGQYTMAAVILKGLGAGGEVSSATVSADGKVGETKGCKISDVSAEGGKLSFTRLDETGFWPVLSSGKAAFDLLPSGLDLSQYLLKVTGLPEGEYNISIDGKPAAKATSRQLAEGWNMTLAMTERSSAIGKLVQQLQSPLNQAWRKASKEKDAEKIAAAQAAIEACEKELQALVQPVPVKVAISK